MKFYFLIITSWKCNSPQISFDLTTKSCEINCNTGFQRNSSGVCVSTMCTILFCTACTLNTVITPNMLDCLTCNAMYHLDTSTGTCKQDCTSANCNTCTVSSGAVQCINCLSLYTLSGSGSNCVIDCSLSTLNCQTCSLSVSSVQCDVCLLGYTRISGTSCIASSGGSSNAVLSLNF